MLNVKELIKYLEEQRAECEELDRSIMAIEDEATREAFQKMFGYLRKYK